MKRIILLSFLSVFFMITSFAQNADRYQLSTHILDITNGKPAPNVNVKLEKQSENDTWNLLDEKKTNNEGRIANFLKVSDGKSNIGIYRLTFYTKSYFESHHTSTFYPFVQVVFELTEDSHYHVPITLSPYGYSTYRGS